MNEGITWISSAPSVASISSNGLLSALSAGAVLIELRHAESSLADDVTIVEWVTPETVTTAVRYGWVTGMRLLAECPGSWEDFREFEFKDIPLTALVAHDPTQSSRLDRRDSPPAQPAQQASPHGCSGIGGDELEGPAAVGVAR